MTVTAEPASRARCRAPPASCSASSFSKQDLSVTGFAISLRPDVVHHGGINTAVHRQEEVFRLKEGGDQMNGFVVDEKRPETVRLGDAAHGLAGPRRPRQWPYSPLACRRAPHPPRLEPPAALCRRGMVHGATAGPGPRCDRPSGPIDLSCRERDRKSLVALARDPFHPVCPGVQVGRLVLRVRPKSDAIE